VKSRIVKQLANNEIELDVAISQLMIIAFDIQNSNLFEWAKKELNGYTSKDELPIYRKLQSGNIYYNGINGVFKMTNQSIPITAFTKEECEGFSEVPIMHSIAALHQLSQQSNNNVIGKDLTYLAENIKKRTGIVCTKIIMKYENLDILNILNEIRTRLLEIFINLESEFGNLDDLDVDIGTITSDKLDTINLNVNTILYADDKQEIL